MAVAYIFPQVKGTYAVTGFATILCIMYKNIKHKYVLLLEFVVLKRTGQFYKNEQFKHVHHEYDEPIECPLA